ncbi:Hypothetical predicted protein [Olea europaea subsp. europaea]|uniref:Uncharacterized protein n=1 Tax=Olea europaea subsp. europaea TaxID=158383 RepID=A0A8S0VFI5_OLEEU|nr:Hypothetical predicted protein [Olea europaea subsp. europaea]
MEVALSGLFYNRDIAVHGLGGMLNCLKTGFGLVQDSPIAAPSEPPIYSPVINGIGAAPHGMNFAGFHEPPYNIIESLVLEPAVFDGYSPANSPKISLSPTDFSINHRNFTPIVNNTAEPPLRRVRDANTFSGNFKHTKTAPCASREVLRRETIRLVVLMSSSRVSWNSCTPCYLHVPESA